MDQPLFSGPVVEVEGPNPGKWYFWDNGKSEKTGKFFPSITLFSIFQKDYRPTEVSHGENFFTFFNVFFGVL